MFIYLRSDRLSNPIVCWSVWPEKGPHHWFWTILCVEEIRYVVIFFDGIIWEFFQYVDINLFSNRVELMPRKRCIGLIWKNQVTSYEDKSETIPRLCIFLNISPFTKKARVNFLSLTKPQFICDIDQYIAMGQPQWGSLKLCIIAGFKIQYKKPRLGEARSSQIHLT